MCEERKNDAIALGIAVKQTAANVMKRTNIYFVSTGNQILKYKLKSPESATFTTTAFTRHILEHV